MKQLRNTALALSFGLLAAAPSAASAQIWTDWNSAWFGTLGTSNVTWTGPSTGGQLTGSGGTDYWSPTGAYTQGGLTAPDQGGNFAFIQEMDPFTGTITFSTAVVNPYISWISVGQSNVPVDLSFGGAAFTVLTNNNTSCAYWACGAYTTNGTATTGTVLTGYEYSGTIQFTGTFSSLTVSSADYENWYGFTVGADRVSSNVVPEPATMSLMATGLVGMFGAGMRRRRRTA